LFAPFAGEVWRKNFAVRTVFLRSQNLSGAPECARRGPPARRGEHYHKKISTRQMIDVTRLYILRKKAPSERG
jgi:hypothetical protein